MQPSGESAGDRPLGAGRGVNSGVRKLVGENIESFLTFKDLLIPLLCTYHCAIAVNSAF